MSDGRPVVIVGETHGRISVRALVRTFVLKTPPTGLVVLNAITMEALHEEIAGGNEYSSVGVWLRGLADEAGKPLAIELVPNAIDFLKPASWTADRLDGWIAGHIDQLERAYGEIVEVGRNGD